MWGLFRALPLDHFWNAQWRAFSYFVDVVAIRRQHGAVEIQAFPSLDEGLQGVEFVR